MESKTINYHGYLLQPNGWKGCVVMKDQYGECIGATYDEHQAKRWIDYLEGKGARPKTAYRSQTASYLRMDGSVSRQKSNRR